ncbi:hypothetical protein B0H11DRAFT_1250665 [Mycena galericulata]|nr:hypothetical protein B0H11DRAFT_1250665 [Mycena galericulata]
MGGTLFACGPDYKKGDNINDLVYAYYRYSAFTEVKGILLRATIAFLTALSSEQISKALLIEKGVVDAEALEGVDEAVTIANYRARISAAIPVLQRWVKTPTPPSPEPNPAPFNILNSSWNLDPATLNRLHAAMNQRNILDEIMAEMPIHLDALGPVAPHTLVELNLAGIHTFCEFPDSNASMPYAQTKDVARMIKMAKPYCVWDDKWDPPEEGEDHFIDEVLKVFEAVPPGGRAFN